MGTGVSAITRKSWEALIPLLDNKDLTENALSSNL